MRHSYMPAARLLTQYKRKNKIWNCSPRRGIGEHLRWRWFSPFAKLYFQCDKWQEFYQITLSNKRSCRISEARWVTTHYRNKDVWIFFQHMCHIVTWTQTYQKRSKQRNVPIKVKNVLRHSQLQAASNKGLEFLSPATDIRYIILHFTEILCRSMKIMTKRDVDNAQEDRRVQHFVDVTRLYSSGQSINIFCDFWCYISFFYIFCIL
jgi:hypothetical protein